MTTLLIIAYILLAVVSILVISAITGTIENWQNQRVRDDIEKEFKLKNID